MSELQIALLAIGVGVIVVVYVLGWLQQRRYSRKFGAAFKANHGDALYQNHPGVSYDQSALAHFAAENGLVSDETTDDSAPLVATILDESCTLLSERSDFIMELELAEACSAVMLDGLWQRKFDFGKPVLVCGLTLQGQQWERAIAEGQTLYVRFRIALQLVDRGGAISAAKLADFRDLVLGVARNIRATCAPPDLAAAHQHALELDEFCAKVDQLVGINLVVSRERLLHCGKVAQAAAAHGMALESDGAFHLLNAQGFSLFSLANQDEKPFLHHTLESSSTAGLTLLLDVPRVSDPAQQFDLMTRIAHDLAAELQVKLVDDHRVALSETGLSRIRAQIAQVEAQMRDNGIVPGSAQARRLFS